LETIVNNMREQTYRYRYEYVKGNSTYNQLIDEHAKIIAGFEKKDSEYVKAIMHTHLENQIEAVRVVIREQE
jgi:DNA-binding GntR family transcriptional regulator